jgi:LacI family transcriptional regulator
VAIDFEAAAYGLDSFRFDNSGAGTLLARKLHSLGHRRIAALFESPHKPADKRDEAWGARRQGFLAELQKRGAPPPIEFHLEDRGGIADALRGLEEALKRPSRDRPTAVVTPDTSPLDSLRTLAHGCGLHIPGDLTVAGFGSLEPGTAMTAVRFDATELGKRATERLLSLLTDPRRPSRRARVHEVKGHYVAGRTHARLSWSDVQHIKAT